ncbi:MAG: DUF1343 domain-containing protein [Candidatus Marinimicrobia bacterium]|nr:DUF1343 domain-containing protein [Candidatus Neomarinimicrobiota bacterium]
MKKYLILIIFPVLIILFMSCNLKNSSKVKVKTGLDVLIKDEFNILKDKKVGIVANHTSVNKNGKHIVDIINDFKNTEVTAIFAPEHGFRGEAAAGKYVENNIDPSTNAPIFSIYGKHRKPNSKMLENVDILIFDIQDIGSRFYTYISTMGNIMEAGAENDIPVIILDRPNPIGGIVEGNVLNKKYSSFVGMYPIPIRHGMTVGELANMIKNEKWINEAEDLKLKVIKLENWDHKIFFPQINLNWIDPSPNMRNFNEAILYPGMCLFEATNFSEGRGTKHPFEWVGAPFINSEEVIKNLDKLGLKGVKFKAITFKPKDMPGCAVNPKFEDEIINGISIKVTDPAKFRSIDFGVNLIILLRDLYPDDFSVSRPNWIDKLWGDDSFRKMYNNNRSANEIINAYGIKLKKFINLRKKYLFYD